MYLNCKTYFSFRYGTFSSKGLVKAAVDTGVTALALTNINSTCDIWDFVKYCREEGIKPITGVEIRNDGQLLYILLAANNNGLLWINEFLSDHLQADKPFPITALEETFFSGTLDGYVIYPLGSKDPAQLFNNEKIGVQPSEVNKLFTIDLKATADKWVIRQPVTFQNKTYFNVHRLLRAIDKNVLLSKLFKADECSPDEYFVPPSTLLNAFGQYPFIVTNTYKLMDN